MDTVMSKLIMMSNTVGSKEDAAKATEGNAKIRKNVRIEALLLVIKIPPLDNNSRYNLP
jgi:hypothetical protein